jgi:hypothetical protein
VAGGLVKAVVVYEVFGSLTLLGNGKTSRRIRSDSEANPSIAGETCAVQLSTLFAVLILSPSMNGIDGSPREKKPSTVGWSGPLSLAAVIASLLSLSQGDRTVGAAFLASDIVA